MGKSKSELSLLCDFKLKVPPQAVNFRRTEVLLFFFFLKKGSLIIIIIIILREN